MSAEISETQIPTSEEGVDHQTPERWLSLKDRQYYQLQAVMAIEQAGYVLDPEWLSATASGVMSKIVDHDSNFKMAVQNGDKQTAIKILVDELKKHTTGLKEKRAA